MQRRSTALTLFLALSLGLSACGGGGGGGGDEGSAANPNGGPSSRENDINPTDRDQLADGGTLRWAIAELPPNFNYHHLNGTLADNADVIGGLMPGAFDFDAEANPTVESDYFESIELTAREPKQQVTYRINPKATWDDGTPITWVDLEAQWKALNGTDDRFTVSSTQGYDKMESVVRGKDDREAIVTFAEPYADWRAEFNPLYPASTNRDPAVFNDGWKDRPLVTAGPFKFESVDRTAQTITVVRNEKWWGRPAKLDRIIYRKIDPDAQVDSLANGEIDFVDIGPDVAKLERAKTIRGVALRMAGGPNFRHITINGTSEILRDVEVRRAIAMAIDRETIARALLGPLGVAPEPLNNHIFMRNQEGYQNNAGELAEADPEQAGKLLDAAGWTLQGTVRKKDGRDLAIRFVIPTGVATSKQEAELVQGMLAPVGVRVNIETVPLDEFFEQYINTGNFDFTVFSWLGTPFPISSSKSIYKNPPEDPQGDIQQNYARVGSPALDALFDKATSVFDEEEAIRLGNEIDTMIWDLAHSLTLYQRPEIVAVQETIGNFGAFGFESAQYEDIGFLK